MELDAFLTLIKDYDLPTILIGVLAYIYINKKLTVVDNAVNNRPAGSPTLSQEVSEIHRKVDVSAVKQDYITKELDAHRKVDEETFEDIATDFKKIKGDISSINRKIRKGA
jgi:hypothetical protein